MAHDIVLEAHEAGGGVIRRTAALLHEPETTVARRLAKAQTDVATSRRSPSWSAVREAMRAVVRSSEAATPASLLDRAEHLVIEEILKQVPDDPRVGAQLLGSSLPTFRRHAATLSILS
ncbi:MAG: hypothetical protein IMZ55_14975 [Acidobacteria bacterium]|nr:hypothetical protein [Acidobacteriota bacterium]